METIGSRFPAECHWKITQCFENMVIIFDFLCNRFRETDYRMNERIW